MPTPAPAPAPASTSTRRHLTSLVRLALLLLLTSCNGRGDDPADRDPADRNPDDRAVENHAPAITEGAAGDRPVCLHDRPFVANGTLPLDPPAVGDAARLADVRWERHGGCERVVLDFVGNDDRPATSTGPVHGEVLRELGVVRISLQDVESVVQDATDARFEGPLARAAYAVWSPDGRWVYVDVHLADPSEAHLLVLADPARVVVDLRPGGGPIPQVPATSPRVVVLEPRPGQASYPLTVTGYARTFEANVVARLERSGEVVLEDFTTATAWVDAWGHYSIIIPDGPAGPVRLHVGEYSAKDGTWEGAALDLEMR